MMTHMFIKCQLYFIIMLIFGDVYFIAFQDIKSATIRTLISIIHIDRNPKYVSLLL